MRKQESEQTRKTVLLVVIGAVVLLVLAGAGSAVFLTARSGGVAKDVVDDYYRALEERRFDDAYGSLCAEVRADQSREAFTSAAEARLPSSHEMTGELRVNGLPWKTTGTVGVSVSYADGTTQARMVSMLREDGDWLICEPSV
ncbi:MULTISPECIES: Rv0361 family membrane protein [unclassified Micromonospora]|uniref:Rv0361 family membrane protein n=1 Tax=Micromonospora sp. NPDC049903 TaxID=3364276 RepID=UPI003796F2F6